MVDPDNMQEQEARAISQEQEFLVEEGVDTSQKSYSQGQLVWRRFLRHKAAMGASAVLIFVILIAFTSVGFGPIPGWWPKNHTSLYPLAEVGGAPTFRLWPFTLGEHPFGQNTIGKDYFALVMIGAQNSLIIAFSVGIGATLIGTVIGAAAGYFRGLAEAFLMRMTPGRAR